MEQELRSRTVDHALVFGDGQSRVERHAHDSGFHAGEVHRDGPQTVARQDRQVRAFDDSQLGEYSGEPVGRFVHLPEGQSIVSVTHGDAIRVERSAPSDQVNCQGHSHPPKQTD